MDTLWLIDSLPQVSWDTTDIPDGSTLDIALLHHAKKESILLRRYVPARLGSTLVNLGPELKPGTYSLLLTVFKGRTSTVVARAMVQSLILIEDVSIDPEQESVDQKITSPLTTTTTTTSTTASPATAPVSSSREEEQEEQEEGVQDEFLFKKWQSTAIQETEQLQLTHQPTKNTLVLKAPYTVGWTIPKALEGSRKSRVNILLVSKDNTGVAQKDQVVKILATNIDAKVGFMYVFLPEDTPLKSYHIKIEIYGKGRKFSGYTHKFYTSLPAFLKRA
ncbi:hypothetical protein BG004_000355 [Podila humilis]|nr:hypothetical protein BG004_000355 [Podila humilis]